MLLSAIRESVHSQLRGQIALAMLVQLPLFARALFPNCTKKHACGCLLIIIMKPKKKVRGHLKYTHVQILLAKISHYFISQTLGRKHRYSGCTGHAQ